MNKLKLDNERDFQHFLYSHIQNRLSGTSVMSIEEVQTTLESVRYVMTHGILEETVERQYLSGKEAILLELGRLKKDVRWIQQLNVLCQSLPYQKTFEELETFINTYDVDYRATETGSAWLDYQLAHSVDDQKFQGIDYISEYVLRLKKEAIFISQLPNKIVQEILISYESKLLFDYRMDVNNLYEVIFNQVIAKLLLNSKLKETALLSIAEKNYLSKLEQYQLLNKITNIIQSDFYYKKSYENLVGKLEKGLVNSLLVKETDELANELKLIEPMSEAEYKGFLIHLAVLPNHEKMSEISVKVTSPYDLDEVMKELYFNPLEWQSFFEQLPLELLFSYLCLIKKEQDNEIEVLTDFFEIEVNETYLNQLILYLRHMDETNQKIINKGLARIKIEKLDLS